MFEGRDEETKDRLAREIADAVAEHTGNSVESIHIIFRETPRSSWSRGMILASRRTPAQGAKLVRTDYASVSRIQYDPKTEREYLALRHDVINPGMATQDGFVSSLLLRPHDRPNEYILVNKWLSEAHAKAYTSGPVHETLRQKAMQVLPKPLETVGADVVHLDGR
jgi:phenylpyruvate tautomerase PptA (4-oxalocrotonate tautomerase family)/heme-degrading monooxygenase HmoA